MHRERDLAAPLDALAVAVLVDLHADARTLPATARVLETTPTAETIADLAPPCRVLSQVREGQEARLTVVLRDLRIVQPLEIR